MKAKKTLAAVALASCLSLGLVACGQASSANSPSGAESPTQAQAPASSEAPAEAFSISEISDEVFARIKGKSFKMTAPSRARTFATSTCSTRTRTATSTRAR